ncbi:neprilysin-2-like [Microplitis mediator]|uniref:neprilysin-2-like n=1 Tax=Microplitis mediator TaxID=375433 RepID=UPI002554D901|nr:neprilysin-2-like [Microplitis mediator]
MRIWQMSLVRGLFLITGIGFVCLIVPIKASSIDSSKIATNQCTTHECSMKRIKWAAEITKHRDMNINPCENFHRFVCGNYEKIDRPNDEFEDDIMKKLHADNLIGDESLASEFKPYKLVQDLHKTCMDQNAVGQQTLDLMKNIMKSLGNWPVLEADKWNESGFNWIDFTGEAKKFGYNLNYFLDWQPESKSVGPNKTLIYLLEIAPVHVDVSTDELPAYKKYMKEVAQLLGASSDSVQELDQVIDFEVKLKEIAEKVNPDETKELSVEKLQDLEPSINWEQFISKTLMPFVDADEKPVLSVWNPTALTELLSLMEKTPKRVQANYAMWRIVQYSIPYLTAEFRDKYLRFLELTGAVDVPRQVICDEMVKTYFENAITNYYLDQFKDSQEAVRNVVFYIKSAMVNMIRRSKTLNDDEKDEGVREIFGMPVTIGPSETLSVPEELNKFYADDYVVMNNFLQTILNMNIFTMVKRFSNKIYTEMFQYDANQHGDQGMPENYANHLYIPAKMLASPLFDNKRPMYMNFGASGSNMASEMYQTVAHIGRKWAEDGTELPNEQVECFSHLMDNVTDPLIRDSRIGRLAESIIAQYIGLRVSYAAYKDFADQSGLEMNLPELSYTSGQLFWISYMESLCSANDDQDQPQTADSNNFTFLENLIMKILSNVPEISADFQCPVGSNINPEDKCTWW